jgi:hypothetical protein
LAAAIESPDENEGAMTLFERLLSSTRPSLTNVVPHRLTWNHLVSACHIPPMQQKTDGRVVRLFTKYVGAEGRSIEQWFLVALGDDDKSH